ncbi:hypothetical protein PHET_07461 [Paragonimus heterotremus]|uniref:Uncharacterized protein n=1 Tax=Paragonimus heterotremus TaxID=100268 RepID=A0A8J4SP40_9TREM|nr:hypothetical protein PHET_07461 [Paragonimus heterotremus]
MLGNNGCGFSCNDVSCLIYSSILFCLTALLLIFQILERMLQLLKMRATSARVVLRVVQDHMDNLGDGTFNNADAEKARLTALAQAFSSMIP